MSEKKEIETEKLLKEKSKDNLKEKMEALCKLLVDW